jgi:transmembrane sensor
MKAIMDPAGQRRREASRWFVVLQQPALPARVLQAWKTWVSVPENRRVFDEIEQLWERTDEIARPRNPTAAALSSDRYDGAGPVAAWQQTRRVVPKENRLRLPHRPLALAAVVTLLVGAAFLLTWNVAGPGSGAGQLTMAGTGIAEKKAVALEDGSKIVLGAKTSITAHMTGNLRTVVLESGEALFDVAPDAKRPFIVRAGSRTITAIGTAFNVRRRGSDEVIVTVTDGVVQIAAQAPGQPGGVTAQARRLERGQQMAYDGKDVTREPRPADEISVLAWTEGRLLYRGEPLRQVLVDVNRYSRRSIVLGDRAAGELLYSGTVFERDVDEWVSNLEKVYPGLVVTPADTDTVLIQTRRSLFAP